MQISTRRRQLLADVPATAEMLGVSPKAIFRYTERSLFPPEIIVRIGKRLYFKRALLERWLGVTNAEDAAR